MKKYRNKFIGAALVLGAMIGAGGIASEAQARGCRGTRNGPVARLVHRWQDRRAERGRFHVLPFRGTVRGGGCGGVCEAGQAAPELIGEPAEYREPDEVRFAAASNE